MGKVYTDAMRVADYTEYYQKKLKLKEKRKEFRSKLINNSKMTMKKFVRHIQQLSLCSEV